MGGAWCPHGHHITRPRHVDRPSSRRRGSRRPSHNHPRSPWRIHPRRRGTPRPRGAYPPRLATRWTVSSLVGGHALAMSQTRLRRREPSQSIRDAEYQDHITLARAVEAIVDRRVRELLGSRGDDEYSSDRLPPGITT